MRFNSWILAVVTLITMSACTSSRTNLHELGPDALYERGIQDYEAERWSRAIAAFERIVSQHPLDPRTEQVQYLIGNAYFEQKDYVTAASVFVRLASDYPNSEYAEHARFKTCEAYYELSPKPQLDQEYTRAAIEHCSRHTEIYPSGEFTERTRELMNDLYYKLAEKDYLSGEFYLKRRAYDSAIIYFEELLENYPESPFTPRALLRLVEIYHTIGYRDEMEAAQARLEREFPDTEQAKKAGEFTLVNGR